MSGWIPIPRRPGGLRRRRLAAVAGWLMVAGFPLQVAAADRPAAAGCAALAGLLRPEVAALVLSPPERPSPLLHQPVSTPVPEAQAAYDRGVSHLALYEWLDAAGAFCDALAGDPLLAVAHQGLAEALWQLDEVPAAHRSLTAARAAARARPPGAHDQSLLLLAARKLALLETPAEDRAAGIAAYRRELERRLPVASRSADDWVLAGLAAEPGGPGHGQGGDEDSLRCYRTALALDPGHLGALHYLVHSLENLRRYAAALPYALLLRDAAPGSPHAQHVAGHLLAHLGRWDEALATFRTADRLHEARFAAGDLRRRLDWHYRHNLTALALASWRLGDEPAAEARLRRLFALHTAGPRDGLSCVPWLEYLLLRRRLPEAAAAARACDARPGVVARIVSRGARAEIALGLADPEEARRQLAAARLDLERLRSDFPPGSRYGFLDGQLTSFLRPPELALRLRGASRPVVERWLGQAAAHLDATSSYDDWALGLLRLERLQRLLSTPPGDRPPGAAEAPR